MYGRLVRKLSLAIKRLLIIHIVHPIYRFLILRFFRISTSANVQQDFSKWNYVLIVGPDAIGDFILLTPILQFLRGYNRTAYIILIANTRYVNLAQTCPYVDKLIPWNQSRYSLNLLYRLHFLRKLRNVKFDIAIYPFYSRKPLSDELVYGSGAPTRIGYVGDTCNINLSVKKKNDKLYTHLISIDSYKTNELDRNRSFIEKLLNVSISAKEFFPELWLTDSDSENAVALLSILNLNPTKDLIIALCPGAQFKMKMWPTYKYSILADKLIKEYNAKIIICGGSGEIGIAQSIINKMENIPVNLAGHTSLRQLAALFDFCHLFIGNDTGPLHIAAARGTPTLCIMGGGHFGRFYPYGDLRKHRVIHKWMPCYHCDWHCIYNTTRCIEKISVKSVWEVAQQMITELNLPEVRNEQRTRDPA